MLMCLIYPKRENAKMGELNEKYAYVVERLDEWIKSYVKEICSGFEPSVMKLYVENTSENLIAENGFKKYNIGRNSSEMQWGFLVNKSIKNESLIILIYIFLEILEEKISSLVALDEVSNILDYLRKGNNDLYKERFFEKISDGKLIQNYVSRVMSELPDKEIFIQLSALNYENRVTHAHLAFKTEISCPSSDNNNIIFDRAMEFEIGNIRLIRKLMEISGETYGLVVEKKSDSEWSIRGARQLKELKNTYQVEITGHSVWQLKHNDEELFEYKEGIYKLPPVGTDENEYDEEYKKLDQIISDEEKRKKVRLVIDKIRKNAPHGTGMVFIEEPITESEEKSFLEKEIDRLARFGKAYAITKHSLDLYNVVDEMLKGITAIDGAVFCNFDLQCKAIGVIVDGQTVKVGNPGRGARYNSLTNYVQGLNGKERNANVNCMAVVISEDGPINIEINIPNLNETSDMLDITSSEEEQSVKRLGKLMKILLNNKRYVDAERASDDEKYREKLYKELEIK